MATYQCKMCSATLNVEPGQRTIFCDSCGTEQTLPISRDDAVINLLNRANRYRLNSDFNAAKSVYEKIINDGVIDPEAYWGLVLCKYGIEYVEDPKTHRRIPTCHRTQPKSVLADVDYQFTVQYCDKSQTAIYQSEAKAIDEVHKEILSIAKTEKPYDVFICYKETDANGYKTKDSETANIFFHKLTQEGYRVFYSAITLKEKVGRSYEPYIYAALNSAKVMLVIGTKTEYFNAPWVKNEWSRYLDIMSENKNRLLIPCYKDMDAYDLPIEFAHFQAQDMGKIDCFENIISAIKNFIPKKEEKPVERIIIQQPQAPTNTNPTLSSLLNRANLFLKDGDFQKAEEYAERVLDIDAYNGEAYIVKLLAENKCKEVGELAKVDTPIQYNASYTKAIEYASAERANMLKQYNIQTWKNKQTRLFGALASLTDAQQYEGKKEEIRRFIKTIQSSLWSYNHLKTRTALEEVVIKKIEGEETLEKIDDWYQFFKQVVVFDADNDKPSTENAIERVALARNERIYQIAQNLFKEGRFVKAGNLFITLSKENYKDSKKMAEIAEDQHRRVVAGIRKEERKEKSTVVIANIVFYVFAVLGAVLLFLQFVPEFWDIIIEMAYVEDVDWSLIWSYRYLEIAIPFAVYFLLIGILSGIIGGFDDLAFKRAKITGIVVLSLCLAFYVVAFCTSMWIEIGSFHLETLFSFLFGIGLGAVVCIERFIIAGVALLIGTKIANGLGEDKYIEESKGRKIWMFILTNVSIFLLLLTAGIL